MWREGEGTKDIWDLEEENGSAQNDEVSSSTEVFNFFLRVNTMKSWFFTGFPQNKVWGEKPVSALLVLGQGFGDPSGSEGFTPELWFIPARKARGVQNYQGMWELPWPSPPLQGKGRVPALLPQLRSWTHPALANEHKLRWIRKSWTI